MAILRTELLSRATASLASGEEIDGGLGLRPAMSRESQWPRPRTVERHKHPASLAR